VKYSDKVKVDNRVRKFSVFTESEVLWLTEFKHTSNPSEILVSHFVILVSFLSKWLIPLLKF